MTILRVKLHTALKSSTAGTVYLPGSIYEGRITELPKAIANAVEENQSFVTVTELQPSDVAVSHKTSTAKKLASKIIPDNTSIVDEGVDKDSDTPVEKSSPKRRTKRIRKIVRKE